MIIRHKNINEEKLLADLVAAGVKILSFDPPKMQTKIIKGVEQAPVKVDGNIEFEGDEAIVLAIIEQHDGKKKEFADLVEEIVSARFDVSKKAKDA